jgi:phenylpyruvate tautomerase PptA (4-oxalocrotonate tautomerase family)
MLELLISPVTQLLDKFIEDKDQKAKLAHEIATMAERHAHELAKGQIEVNKNEANHKSIFVAGWRPFIGWTCGLALLYHYLIQPIAVFAVAVYGTTIELPTFDMASLMTVLLGMLGLGGLRTFEKYKGVDNGKRP